MYQFIPNPPLLTPFEEAIEIAATQTKSACADLVIMPFAEGKWQMRMSLKALDPQDWIEIDDQFVKYLSQKDTLLKTRHSEVFASLPGTEASQKEVLDLP